MRLARRILEYSDEEVGCSCTLNIVCRRIPSQTMTRRQPERELQSAMLGAQAGGRPAAAAAR